MTAELAKLPVLVEAPGVTLTQTGLRIKGEKTVEEWATLLHQLTVIGQASQWAIGDLLVYGELRKE